MSDCELRESPHTGSEPAAAPYRVSNRVLSALIACALGFVLALAAWLTPDTRGHGTHEQLRMPPCVTMEWLHTPCPLCGMTTSFAWMAHGNPLRALATQPAGAIGFVVCSLLFLAALLCFVQPAWYPRIFEGRAAELGSRMGLIVIVLGWAYKLGVHFLV